MHKKNIYNNEEWKIFSKQTIKEKGETCSSCKRTKDNQLPDGSFLVLQLHHTFYEKGRKPWEYEPEDLEVLCKGCHAREHKIIEPNRDWLLLSINDLGQKSGFCESQKEYKICNTPIRYEHEIYHPDPKNGGYRIVGSTCVDHLTEEDKTVSENIIKLSKKISNKIKNINNSKQFERGWTQTDSSIEYISNKTSNGIKNEIKANVYDAKYKKSLYIYINNKRLESKNHNCVYIEDMNDIRIVISLIELYYQTDNKEYLLSLIKKEIEKYTKCKIINL